jgi:hypothetical protein
MREKFKQALLDIITGPFTNTNGLMWMAYKDHLRNINPEDLPKKVQTLFLELREIFESRFDAALQHRKESWAEAVLETSATGYSWWKNNRMSLGSWYNKERKPNEQEMYQAILNSDLMHNTQHPTAKRIKGLIFEIMEKLPKRKSKNAKENKAADIEGNKAVPRIFNEAT